MPGARAHGEPAAAARDLSASDEAELLERCLQTEFEEDVARIFDESLYSDLELVSGRSKVKTHTCILKARTHKFYQKLDKILHVDINRNTYDEIYSFISDAYTECNIRHQEKEIIQYLNDLELSSKEAKVSLTSDKIADHSSERGVGGVGGAARGGEVFLTPPRSPRGLGSPSVDLNKDYYALVQIETSILEKELNEQDELSNAFHSINKAISGETCKSPNRKKPTSLPIRSSHSSKNIVHSNSNGDVNKNPKRNLNTRLNKGFDFKINPSTRESSTAVQERASAGEAAAALSPDSLASGPDEPSSSSDYLSVSGTHLTPPTAHTTIHAETSIKMDNAFTSSDSGLDSSHMLESLNGQRDVTLTDVSLTESTLHDLTTDDASRSASPQPPAPAAAPAPAYALNNDVTSNVSERAKTKAPNYISKSSKEEKQRQNEEIVILESSSLSSETGSWEPVFPPRVPNKDVCTSFLANERNAENTDRPRPPDSTSEVQQSPFKSKFCFIDASSLVDDDEDRTKIQIDNESMQCVQDKVKLPTPSQPVPCAPNKHDASPNDWSEGHDHDDSLEQADAKEPDSLQKDLSPTIFDMTPITEDSLSTNPFDALRAEDGAASQAEAEPEKAKLDAGPGNADYLAEHVLVSNTPHNSIMAVRPSVMKQPDSESESESGRNAPGPSALRRLPKFTEGSPIVSGGASVEDHLPQLNAFTGSPSTRRKIENVPIVSGAYIPEDEPAKLTRKSPKSLCAPAWVVDMSDTDSKASTESLNSMNNKRPGDRACENLRSMSKYNSDNISKSRSSVESDSSERSSHKFYIDLASLPGPAQPAPRAAAAADKKNIFSIYIDLGENTTLKEMPARLSSSLNAKKQPEAKSDKNLGKSSTTTKSATQNKAIAIFERYEALCSNPDISITEIISMPVVPTKTNVTTEDGDEPKSNKVDKAENNKKQVNEKVPRPSSSDLFVRLSDLDKPIPKRLLDSANTIYEHSVSDVRMTRSIPGSGWEGSRGDVISSFHSENAASLHRLFPHLRAEFSRSTPGSLARSPPPPALAPDVSDMSEISSVQSSYCRSVVENSTTEESQSQTSSLIGSCQSKLGQDLLRMFLEEIAPDVVVEVSGKRFKAHKCILSSRCQYFAGILSGGWVESAGNVIILPPFSYNVVHFALCHIYSGLSTIPDSVSILELATIADMLGLEGLKEAIMFTLKAKYCHHFHKPCSVCTAGVLECFPLSSVYGLDDLYRKCLRWITKHFHKVWPTKAFATLPKELLDKCYQQHIINMSLDNVIDTICACGVTEASLSMARWAETVASMLRRLVAAAALFAGARLAAALRASGALPPDLPPPAAAALDAALSAAIDSAPPHEVCRAYAFLSYLVKELRSQQTAKPDLVSHGDLLKVVSKSNYLWGRAGEWRARCERSIVRAAPRALDTDAYRELPPELRARLRDLGCIPFGSPSAAAPVASAHKKNNLQKRSSTSRIDIDHVRASFVPYAPKPTLHQTIAIDPSARARKSERASYPPKIRTTKAQEERAKFNMAQSNPTGSNKNLSKPVKFENTKPRYLQPRQAKEGERRPAAHRLAGKGLSSSESSRNTSPVLARAARRPRTAEPSTDSLSESQTSNKYATYTKSKNSKGSLESTKSSSQQTIPPVTKSSTRTKIPVYLNHARSGNLPQKRATNGEAGAGAAPGKPRVSGSLMMATKSSSAKMVARPREPPPPRRSRPRAAPAPAPAPAPVDIPLMERSGTFLKDEPMFGDKTTNIDIAQ